MSAKVLQKVLLVSMCLMLMAFVLPQTVFAWHSLYVEDENQDPAVGIYVEIGVRTSSGWQYVQGYTNNNGIFFNDMLQEMVYATYFTFEILDPLYVAGPFEWYYPDREAEWEI